MNTGLRLRLCLIFISMVTIFTCLNKAYSEENNVQRVRGLLPLMYTGNLDKAEAYLKSWREEKGGQSEEIVLSEKLLNELKNELVSSKRFDLINNFRKSIDAITKKSIASASQVEKENLAEEIPQVEPDAKTNARNVENMLVMREFGKTKAFLSKWQEQYPEHKKKIDFATYLLSKTENESDATKIEKIIKDEHLKKFDNSLKAVEDLNKEISDAQPNSFHAINSEVWDLIGQKKYGEAKDKLNQWVSNHPEDAEVVKFDNDVIAKIENEPNDRKRNELMMEAITEHAKKGSELLKNATDQLQKLEKALPEAQKNLKKISEKIDKGEIKVDATENILSK